jgi:hypothetical protein
MAMQSDTKDNKSRMSVEVTVFQGHDPWYVAQPHASKMAAELQTLAITSIKWLSWLCAKTLSTIRHT